MKKRLSCIFLLFGLFSCSSNVEEKTTFSFIEYSDNYSEGFKHLSKDCFCTEEYDKGYYVWKYTDCMMSAVWYISDNPNKKSMFVKGISDTIDLLIIDSFYTYTTKVMENKVVIFTERKEVMDGNHYYYYNSKYGIFLIKSTSWYSGIELTSINNQYSDSLQSFLLAARVGIERLNNNNRE
jgi:hypothetical protein